MRRIQSDIIVGLMLIILLLSVIPVLAADNSMQSSGCAGIMLVSPINKPDQADKERGQTSNEYGSLSLHARAGMTGTETGDVKSEASHITVICRYYIEKGYPNVESFSVIPYDEGFDRNQ